MSVSKSITEFLEQNEKRFTAQQAQHEQDKRLIERLESRLTNLEKNCEELAAENNSLREELEVVKKREVEMNITIKADIEKMSTKVNECSEWIRLISALTQQVQDLNKSMDSVNHQVSDLHKNQNDCNKLLEEQQRQISATTNTATQALKAVRLSPNHHSTTRPPSYINNRIPVRSPSTSSFFSSEFHNNNPQAATPIPQRYKHTHRQSPTNQYLNHMPRDDYLSQLDPNYELVEISESAESLIKNVETLNDLHRSFEKNSLCSDD